MKKKLGTVAVSLALILALTACGTNNGGPTPSQNPDNQQTPATEPSKTPETIAVEMELSSGHYTAGIDFPAGKYDITAIKGGGNIISDNFTNGGINAMMGTEEKDAGMGLYQQEYANINLPSGTRLSVSGLTVNIKCEAADGAPLSAREQTLTETVELGNGNFISGEDFPAGTYTITATEGNGTVSSDNLIDGGINSIMGVEDPAAIIDYVPEYKNVELPEGITLSVNRVKITLTPSK